MIVALEIDKIYMSGITDRKLFRKHFNVHSPVCGLMMMLPCGILDQDVATHIAIGSPWSPEQGRNGNWPSETNVFFLTYGTEY